MNAFEIGLLVQKILTLDRSLTPSSRYQAFAKKIEIEKNKIEKKTQPVVLGDWQSHILFTIPRVELFSITLSSM